MAWDTTVKYGETIASSNGESASSICCKQHFEQQRVLFMCPSFMGPFKEQLCTLLLTLGHCIIDTVNTLAHTLYG